MKNNMGYYVQNIINQIEETTGNPVSVITIEQMIFVSIKNKVGMSNAKVGDMVEAIAFLNGYLMGWMSKTEQVGGEIIPYHCSSPNKNLMDDGEYNDEDDEKEPDEDDSIYNAVADAINRILSEHEEDDEDE